MKALRLFRVELWATVGNDPGHLAGMPDLVVEAIAARTKKEAEAVAEESLRRMLRVSGTKRIVVAEATEIEESAK